MQIRLLQDFYISKKLQGLGVLLLTACQSEQTPLGSSAVSVGTIVAEAFTQEDIREGTGSDERSTPGKTAEDKESTAPSKTEEEVPA